MKIWGCIQDRRGIREKPADTALGMAFLVLKHIVYRVVLSSAPVHIRNKAPLDEWIFGILNTLKYVRRLNYSWHKDKRVES